MLVEPPRPHVPSGHRLSPVEALRLGAAAAGLVMAALSRGDSLVVAAVLALAAWRPIPVLALAPALVASSWRWGSTSLEALSGAQAVLGPAGWVGPRTAAAASWLAAAAVLLAATRALDVGGRHPRPTAEDADLAVEGGLVTFGGDDRGRASAARPDADGRTAWRAPGGLGAVVLALAAGATAAALVAGPAPGGAILVRVAATVVASGIALGVSVARRRTGGAARVLDVAAAVLGIAALAAAAVDAGAWSGTVSTGALREGVAVALAAAALAVVSTGAAAAMGARRA